MQTPILSILPILAVLGACASRDTVVAEDDLKTDSGAAQSRIIEPVRTETTNNGAFIVNHYELASAQDVVIRVVETNFVKTTCEFGLVLEPRETASGLDIDVFDPSSRLTCPTEVIPEVRSLPIMSPSALKSFSIRIVNQGQRRIVVERLPKACNKTGLVPLDASAVQRDGSGNPL